jgi:hypothetical protein
MLTSVRTSETVFLHFKGDQALYCIFLMYIIHMAINCYIRNTNKPFTLAETDVYRQYNALQ